jgi:peptide/nickel transport system substrate-binding protein
MMLCAIAVFAGGQPEATVAQKAQVLRVGQVGPLQSLEPYRNATPNYLYIDNVFDQLLVNYKASGNTAELAESWELGPGNKSIRMKLRPNIRSHAGKDVDAEFVKWNIEERIKIADKGVALYGQLGVLIDRVEILDKLTFIIHFNKAVPNAEDIMGILPLADPDMFIKADGTTALGNQADKLIGTGAFKVESYVPGSHMHWVKFDQYWEPGLPKLDKVEIRFFGDGASMVAALEAGEINLAFRPSFEDAVRLSKDSRFTLWVPKTQGLASILMINPQSPALQDVRVRQAINHAINRDAINRAAYGNMGTPTAVPVLKTSFAYSPELEIPVGGDMNRARELVQQAGAVGATVKITYASNDAEARIICEVIASNLKDIGINAQLDPVEQNIYTQKRTSQDFDLLPSVIAGTNMHPVGLQDSFVYRSVNNPFFAKITPQKEYLEFAEQFNKGIAATSAQEAAEAFKKALVASKNGAWVTPLVGLPYIMVSSSNVKEVTWTAVDKPVFKYAYIE